ncbi:hypothetical protein [Levilactobacillus enshiensis]|uniref:hypothetical protein n=1 Tax=Levilactobacillus enshiensis TaxID=2590213 RepID=UPI00117B5742|nr:hypothetical protein [Levilactobacillus enshiensis]
MVQLYTWAYNDWKTIDKDGLKKLVGMIGGITAADYKTITNEDYVADTAPTEATTDTKRDTSTAEA